MPDLWTAGIFSLMTGFLASIVGLGGGFLFVPELTLIFGLGQKTAVGTSLATMIFSSCAATIVYRRQGRLLIPAAALLAVPAMVTSLAGSVITLYCDSRILIPVFVMVLLLMSLQMLVPALSLVPALRIGPSLVVAGNSGSGTPTVRIPLIHLSVWGAAGGLVSGITGVSGGAFYVPALVAAGVPVHAAVATSLFAIIPISATGAATHAAFGQVSFPYLTVFGAGAVIGAFTGASVSPRIREDHIRKAFGILLIFIAILMIWRKVLGG